MKCPKCDAENPDVAKFCSSCGASVMPPVPEVLVPPPVTECPACKTPRPEGGKFCSACGHAYEEAVAVPAAQAGLASEPGAPGNPLPETPKAEASPTAPSAAQPVQGSNTTVIVVVAVLLALIAAGGGWYFFKDKSGSPSSVASASAVASQSSAQPVDANGMPVKQPGTDGAQSGQTPQAGMPQVDANGMPVAASGSAASMPVQPNSAQAPVAGSQQPAAQPAEEIMPEPMSKEARKRRAKSETDVQPRRRVRAGGTIDQQLEIRGAAECPAGGSGFWCREKIRYQLCNGHWSHNPPPGQSMCQRAN